MGKQIFIAEKPSVAQQFAAALGVKLTKKDGYLEGDDTIVTWCVGHLVRLSYPDVYDEKFKKWRLDTIPFIPSEFKYEVIDEVKKQFAIVSNLLTRSDVETIYVCTDAGREGEYIYRLVEMQANVTGKNRKRVWIDSQTDEEILRGIREAKDLSEYDNLSESAYLRAKEDYLMGINFSRALSLKYGNSMASFLNERFMSIAVGRVMTCVLGMIVRREREIRAFDKTPFYRVIGDADFSGNTVSMEWKAVEGSKYFESPVLYKENGFKKLDDANTLIESLTGEGVIAGIDKKKEKKNPPLLYNLAELQNDCSKFFKISPDETLAIAQELYEKKMTTYPRTDARVVSTAVCKEITKNLNGLKGINSVKPFVENVLDNGLYNGLEKTRYCDDKKITDHYAIIPTGQINALKSLSNTSLFVYEAIVRRFLAIFYPQAVFEKIQLDVAVGNEHFFANQKYLETPGYLEVMEYSFKKKDKADDKTDKADKSNTKSDTSGENDNDDSGDDYNDNSNLSEIISTIKKGDGVSFVKYYTKEGETKPPKRYNSGEMIIAMENAGKLIEDEELREQIKGAGIGTSATRAEILKKLVDKKYINLNKKTQIYSPNLVGEMIYDVVDKSIPSLLNAELTASWEKGLSGVADGSISGDEYMSKLSSYVTSKTEKVKQTNNQTAMTQLYRDAAQYYKGK